MECVTAVFPKTFRGDNGRFPTNLVETGKQSMARQGRRPEQPAEVRVGILKPG